MIKNLNDKIFKYYIYIEYYNIILDLIQSLRSENVVNITFNKKLRILKKYLI